MLCCLYLQCYVWLLCPPFALTNLSSMAKFLLHNVIFTVVAARAPLHIFFQSHLHFWFLVIIFVFCQMLFCHRRNLWFGVGVSCIGFGNCGCILNILHRLANILHFFVATSARAPLHHFYCVMAKCFSIFIVWLFMCEVYLSICTLLMLLGLRCCFV